MGWIGLGWISLVWVRVVLAGEGALSVVDPQLLTRALGRDRSSATLLAGRDRGSGRQKSLVCSSDCKSLGGRGWGPGRVEPLGSVLVESHNGATMSGYQCGIITARTINDQLTTEIKETIKQSTDKTKRSLSPVDETRVSGRYTPRSGKKDEARKESFLKDREEGIAKESRNLLNGWCMLGWVSLGWNTMFYVV